MDVHGSPVSVDPWGMVLELEGLGSVIKRTKRKCPVGLEVQLLGNLVHRLVLSLISVSVMVPSPLLLRVTCTNSCSHSMLFLIYHAMVYPHFRQSKRKANTNLIMIEIYISRFSNLFIEFLITNCY